MYYRIDSLELGHFFRVLWSPWEIRNLLEIFSPLEKLGRWIYISSKQPIHTSRCFHFIYSQCCQRTTWDRCSSNTEKYRDPELILTRWTRQCTFLFQIILERTGEGYCDKYFYKRHKKWYLCLTSSKSWSIPDEEWPSGVVYFSTGNVDAFRGFANLPWIVSIAFRSKWTICDSTNSIQTVIVTCAIWYFPVKAWNFVKESASAP